MAKKHIVAKISSQILHLNDKIVFSNQVSHENLNTKFRTKF